MSRCCDLVSYPNAVIWDADEGSLLLVKGSEHFQSAEDAMYLADGELYTLVTSRRADEDGYRLQLWCGIPGTAIRCFDLPTRWLNEGVEVRFSPDGDFVIASSIGQILMWRTMTGDAVLTADGCPYRGSILTMVVGLALLHQDDMGDAPSFGRRLGWTKSAA